MTTIAGTSEGEVRVYQVGNKTYTRLVPISFDMINGRFCIEVEDKLSGNVWLFDVKHDTETGPRIVSYGTLEE